MREAKRRADSAQRAIEALAGYHGRAPGRARAAGARPGGGGGAAAAADHHATDGERRADRLTGYAKQTRAEHAEASTKVKWAVRVIVGWGSWRCSFSLSWCSMPARRASAVADPPAARGGDCIRQHHDLLEEKPRFLFIVSAFLALGLFIGFASYYRTKNTPKLAPAAALRVDGTIVFGYFVAETDKDVYIARPETTGVRARILQLPRSEVTDVAVASSRPRRTSRCFDARGIARRLCSEGARGAAAGVGTSAKAKAMGGPRPGTGARPRRDRVALRERLPRSRGRRSGCSGPDGRRFVLTRQHAISRSGVGQWVR